ncbi:MAG TPA: bifunctional homocysteine S-methyltransferase/methylenetetrahydrofolate reductase, partial [Candidatus Polarisedimenticolia bacterium]|nr:bifunctional homocysteine S-methyltransferase/methylenetetrahydrofolate reductase [Candidatus Polarisedimenticolia bacterium]
NIVVFDGAMGTELYNRGVFINRCFDEMNLSSPDLVRDVHRGYRKAGVDVLETNTFGANRLKLRLHGFEERLAEINKAGAALAREIAGDDLYVAGSMGPLGVKIEPWGPTGLGEARTVFREQAAALAEAGADLISLETFSDLNEIEQAILAVRDVCDLPIVAHMTLEEDGSSLYGTAPEVFTRRLDELGADVIGVNCSVGPHVMLNTVERMVRSTTRPIAAQPNAGTPRNVEGRNIYLCSPEYMGTYAKRYIQAGAKVVGGCCGTTPEHLKSIIKSVRMLRPAQRRVEIFVPSETKISITPVPQASKSPFAARLAAGDFVTSVELNPPKGIDTSKVMAGARFLKEHGVDAVNIPDGARASARMGPMFLSLMMEREIGIQTILHYCCRDRNLLGMQADLLGAYAIGLRNILIITGDPPKLGDYPDATAVFDVDAIGLTNMVNRLNHGFDLGGNPIGAPTGYLVGVGANPGAMDLEFELKRFQYKVEAGAEFAITQPVFDVAQLKTFLMSIEHCRIPIIAGIWPLASLRNAEFMNNEVPGVHVPEEIMERMRRAEERAEGASREEGIQIARETLLEVRHLVQGVQVSAPFGKVERALDVISVVRTA